MATAPPLWIQPIIGDLEAVELIGQFPQDAQGLSGKRLVHLPDVDVVGAESRPVMASGMAHAGAMPMYCGSRA